jgi:Na+-transporting NADH:ubiquinone oxidoreductase subunit B
MKFLKQKNMKMMLYGLIFLVLYGIFLFGWRVLALIITANVFAVLTEYLFVRSKKNNRVSMAAMVTATLLALSVPPTLPFWMMAVGSIVAITFGKMVFGGFGMNMFNPAMVGRTFIYVAFANAMTVNWLQPFTKLPGGLSVWQKIGNLTSATPMIHFRDMGELTELSRLFFGFIPGSVGETSAFLIILIGIYLIWTKTAKWQPMLATLLSFSIFAVIFYGANPLPFIFSGGLMFGIVFITTDPVSMPKNKTAIWVYGFLIGFLTVLIRKYSLFVEGFMFAVIITNSFMPIIEVAISKLQKKKRS